MRILYIVFMQVLSGLFCWGCYLVFVAITESDNWTPFGVFGLDILKSLALTIVASAGLTAFGFCLVVFRAYAD